ncbi:MAG TPA: glycine cleavage system protein GcvH [Opitutales bacterium]|nr:glycine cleavage system protein GcvH [Opitutales bacterium]
MKTPNDLKFLKSHEWIKVDADNIATIGISDHAQDSLGDITFVELPDVGDTFEKGDPFGVVESVKAASDIYAPAAGEVVAINEDLDSEPEKLNQSPYEEGWLIKLKISDPADLDDLLSADEYEASI